MYPDKSMVLVLDNAGYHHWGPHKLKKMNSYHNKSAMVTKLREMYPEWTELPLRYLDDNKLASWPIEALRLANDAGAGAAPPGAGASDATQRIEL